MPKIGDRWGRTLGMKGVAHRNKNAPPNMCNFAECHCSALKGVDINRGELQKLGNTGAPPLGTGNGWPFKNKLLPMCVITSNLVVLHQQVYA